MLSVASLILSHLLQNIEGVGPMGIPFLRLVAGGCNSARLGVFRTVEHASESGRPSLLLYSLLLLLGPSERNRKELRVLFF